MQSIEETRFHFRSIRSVACFMAAALIIMVAVTPSVASNAHQDGARNGAWLEKKIQTARRGATIDVPAGRYDLTDLKIRRSVTLRGADDGEVIFQSAAVTDKGILVPLFGVSLTVQNITFANATSWDHNGAGIRHEGRDLSVINCRFLNNEDGILATGEPEGVISISDTEFTDNGFGDGQSHAIYVLNAARLTVEKSRFVGTRIGHHVKSLADETLIKNSFFDDAHGRTSYTLDASKGGVVTVTGNTIIQSADGDNNAIINYDLTRGGNAGAVRIVDNKITNHLDGGVLLRNATTTRPEVVNNEIDNKAKKPLKIR